MALQYPILDVGCYITNLFRLVGKCSEPARNLKKSACQHGFLGNAQICSKVFVNTIHRWRRCYHRFTMQPKYLSTCHQRVCLTWTVWSCTFFQAPSSMPTFFTHCRQHLIEGRVGWAKKYIYIPACPIRCDTSTWTCDCTHINLHGNAYNQIAKETLQQDDNTKAVEC